MDYFAKRIIPCLDVKDGRVVKGVNFVGLKDAGDPVEIAKRYNEEGADELTFLDITASHEERDTIVHIVEQVAKEVFIPLTGIVDLAAERDRLAKRIVKVEKDITVFAKKLSNPSFADKAPAEVVADARAKLADFEAQREKLTASLAALSSD